MCLKYYIKLLSILMTLKCSIKFYILTNVMNLFTSKFKQNRYFFKINVTKLVENKFVDEIKFIQNIKNKI